MNILVLNGPNLNLLGTREPEIYGSDTLDDIAERCRQRAQRANANVEFRQSNYEGKLVDWIQEAIGQFDALIINPAAYTHTSIALHDALLCYGGLKIELHISNPHLREPFRHHSHVSTAADVVIMGLGVAGYEHAIDAAIEAQG
ncbi:MAG: type II 3-dehydroquinate dehydratase [Pseudomonadota bacterium]